MDEKSGRVEPKGKANQDEEEECPTHEELMALSESNGPVWKQASKIMSGAICWKCYMWRPFFKCDKCGRSYHRECVFMKPGYPMPVFDKGVEAATKAVSGLVKLLECPMCIVSVYTEVAPLRNVSQGLLNSVFSHVACHMTINFADILTPVVGSITLEDIQEKSSKGLYQTIEGFYADYKDMYCKTVAKHALESEQAEVAGSVIKLLSMELKTMLACFECYVRRWDSNGKILSAVAYMPANRQPCKVPHVIIWLKEPPTPFWPAKLLGVDNEILVIQNFNETAKARHFSLPPDDNGAEFQIFSNQYPGICEPKSKKYLDAKAECSKYITNLREMYGHDGVVIPEDPEPFDGDVKAAMKEMFPLYNENADLDA